jgi:AmmeMemoRadiSam system protein B
MRQSIVDGQFYASDKENLKKQIENCFKDKLGPGLSSEKKDKNIIGVICPHAGYSFSGPCQAFSYKEIAESKTPDVFILLGLSHSGFNSCISIEDWQTSLGIIKVDQELAKKINLPIDEVAHQNEHSIEVQLPFLQFISKKEIKILPIIISADINIKEFAQNLVKALDKKTTIIIASSDFTHYGSNYNFTPFTNKIKENITNLDKEAINEIKNLNSEKFLEKAQKTTICGQYPIAALIEVSKLLKAKETHLLKYYLSGDLTENYTNSVSYASILIK